MTTQTSFLFFTMVCCAIGVAAAWRLGKRYLVGFAIASSLLAASWFHWGFFHERMNVQSAVAAIAMIAFCVHSGRKIWSPLTVLDILVASMVVWNVIVDSVITGWNVSLPFLSYGEWALPYVTGRFAVMHHGALGKLAPFIAAIAGMLGLCAVLESVTGVNLWETLFIDVDDLVKLLRKKRFGFTYRAIGPTRHPIFLSVVMMLMLPWVVAKWEASETKQARRWSIAIGVAVLAGILATVSRGPVLALLVGAAFLVGSVNRTARIVLLTLILLGGPLAWWQQDRVVSWLDSTQGDQRGVVEVDGEQQIYSGTRNRLYVVQVYGPLVLRGGPMGYGTEASSTFPPNIPGLPANAKSRERLGVVDNSFILTGLRLGWGGMGLLISLFVVAIASCVSLRHSATTYFYPAGEWFVLVFAATLVAVAVEINTVFWAYDFAFWVLLSLGVVSGMNVRMKLAQRGIDD